MGNDRPAPGSNSQFVSVLVGTNGQGIQLRRQSLLESETIAEDGDKKAMATCAEGRADPDDAARPGWHEESKCPKGLGKAPRSSG